MTQEEKIEYMKMAAGLCNFGFSHEQLDLLVSIYELVIEEKGDTCLSKVFKLSREAEDRANVKARQDALDKVSKKIE